MTQFLVKELLPQVKEAFGLYKTADKAELEPIYRAFATVSCEHSQDRFNITNSVIIGRLYLWTQFALTSVTALYA